MLSEVKSMDKQDEIMLLLSYLSELRQTQAVGDTAELIDQGIAKTVEKINELLFEN
jgi:hypothetical protein